MKIILAPLDFSRVSRDVIHEAMALARIGKGSVVLLHAVQPPAIVTDLAPMVGEALQFTAEVERKAQQHLHRLQKRLAEPRVIVATRCLQGSPVPLILAQAKELGADYIVLGSHGRTALYDLVVGSTTSGVLKRATCPVVVVSAQPKTKVRRSRRASPKRRP